MDGYGVLERMDMELNGYGYGDERMDMGVEMDRYGVDMDGYGVERMDIELKGWIWS